MNPGIFSNNDSFLFPKDVSGNISTNSIGPVSYATNSIMGLGPGFTNFNNISGEFPSSNGISGVTYQSFVKDFADTIYSFPTNNNFNWNPNKFVVVFDTTKNGSLTLDNTPVDLAATSYVSIDWGDGTSVEISSGFNANPSTTFRHTYKKHGIYIIQMEIIGTSFSVGNPLNGGIGTIGQRRSAGNIGILSFGNPTFIDGHRSFAYAFSSSAMPNLLFLPDKLPNSVNPVSGTGLSNNITILTNLFTNRRLLSRDLLNYRACENWDTTNINNMLGLFSNCNPPRDLYLGRWNTINVTDFSSMFNTCLILGNGLENWNTSNATNMNSMFINNSILNTDLSNWNTSNVTNMVNMFRGCSAFNSSLSGWNVGKATDMNLMFQTASSFRGSGLENWNPSGVTNFSSMFSSAGNFNANLSGWNTSNVTDMNFMFNGCVSFRGSGLENWNTNKVTNMNTMFQDNANFNANLSGWNVGLVTNMTNMFRNCPAFIGSGLQNWNPSGCTNFTSMFQSATNFNNNLSGWNTNNATTMNAMFFNATNFRGSGLENWNLARLNASTSLTSFAQGCNFPSGQYDLILNSWNNNKSSGVNGIANWRTDLSPHFGSSKYTAAGSGARASLISYGWTITDGGLQS